jgi:hypothetical protein
MNFIFENEKLEPLEELSNEGQRLVIDSWINGEYVVQEQSVLHRDRWVLADININKLGIYRVLAKPYTLEDALNDVGAIYAKKPGQITNIVANEVMDIMRKMAASMGGDK